VTVTLSLSAQSTGSLALATLDGDWVLGHGTWGCGNQSRDHDDGLHAMTGPTG
jgi:hypothetical protein